MRAPFLAHEDEGNGRREQIEGRRGASRLRLGEGCDALPEQPVAHLVVVLDEVDEGDGRQVSAWRALGLPPARRHAFALETEASRQRFRQPVGAASIVVGIVREIALDRDIHQVMEIIVPLRVVKAGAQILGAAQPFGVVAFVLDHEVNIATVGRSPDL